MDVYNLDDFQTKLSDDYLIMARGSFLSQHGITDEEKVPSILLNIQNH